MEPMTQRLSYIKKLKEIQERIPRTTERLHIKCKQYNNFFYKTNGKSIWTISIQNPMAH